MLRILLSVGNIVFSLILGALLMAVVAIYSPETLSMMLGWARSFKGLITSTGLNPKYNIWLELLLEERQLVADVLHGHRPHHPGDPRLSDRAPAREDLSAVRHLAWCDGKVYCALAALGLGCRGVRRAPDAIQPHRGRPAMGLFFVIAAEAQALVVAAAARAAALRAGGRHASASAGLMIYYSVIYPDPLSLRPKENAPFVRILARDGSVITERGGGDDYVPLDLLPPYVSDAVIATEDQRFYDHHGVDPLGMVRAAVTNLREGRHRAGRLDPDAAVGQEPLTSAPTAPSRASSRSSRWRCGSSRGCRKPTSSSSISIASISAAAPTASTRRRGAISGSRRAT